jgi:hypothetical protein
MIDRLEPGTVMFRFLRIVCALAAALLACTALAATPDSLIPDPGAAQVESAGKRFKLSNGAIEGVWEISNGKVTAVSMTNRLDGKPMPVPERLFELTITNGAPVSSESMKVALGPKVERLAGNASASRLAERFDGQQVTVELESENPTLHAFWRIVLRDGSNYFRQELTLQAPKADVEISSIRLVDMHVPDASISGVVKGSPVVAGNLFFGFEHPISDSRITQGRVLCSISRELPLLAGQSITYSSVAGVTPNGQLRRGFLNYVERERAHPYRPFLHYNSWYDIGYFSKFDEGAAVGVIRAYGAELVEKRGVKMDSFLFDDGWDDNATLWHFDRGFPHGFTPLKEAAAKYGAAPGVWLSPWGGYGKPHDERVAYGKKQGFETNEGGFALSGPKYFARFRETTLDFVNRYGVNQFKIDGTGNVNSAIKGSEFDSDFHAAISLIREWRRIKPDIYVNLTTGTYPSPFWLQYADSIWRGGEDHSFLGVGSNRQKWITYRDSDTFAGVVQAGPLYPLNSLMLHGLIYARHAHNLGTDPDHDFASEVRDYFGTGTQLQEMYVTPALLQDADWDVIAECAKWSRSNSDVLVDTHWIGGDPAMLEVYGWASWSPRKGILVLRNPSDHLQAITIDLQNAFELPEGATRKYSAHSPWQKDAGQESISLTAGESHVFQLEPFEVLTLDMLPQ